MINGELIDRLIAYSIVCTDNSILLFVINTDPYAMTWYFVRNHLSVVEYKFCVMIKFYLFNRGIDFNIDFDIIFDIHDSRWHTLNACSCCLLVLDDTKVKFLIIFS